ncbi:exonuclease, RdgC family protein, partial [Vibrio parahaemolyticus AQ3810]
RIR